MARTIRWPPVFTDGRLEWVEGAEATAQLVRLALTRGRSANPFTNREGVEPWVALAGDGEAITRTRIARTFRELEGARRARLLSLSFVRDGAAGELRAVIEYEDLEHGRRERLEGQIDG